MAAAVVTARAQDGPSTQPAPAPRGESTAPLGPATRDRETADLLAALGPKFARFETPHFIVLSDCRPDWTQARAGLLERARHQFLRTASRLGLPATEPATKLVCVLFRDHSEYRAYASRNDGLAAAWVAGYYSARTNRVVFFNDSSSPTYVGALAKLDDYSSQARETRRKADEAARSGRGELAARLTASAEDLERQIDAQRKRLKSESSGFTTAKTIHEAVHLLAFNTGVQARDHEYPFWLSEGLATSFETDTPDGAFGPDTPDPDRAARHSALAGQGKLPPLEEVVRVVEYTGSDAAAADALYLQAHALFLYLYRTQRQQLGQFIVALGQEPPGRLGPDRHEAMFRGFFGDPASIERRMKAGR